MAPETGHPVRVLVVDDSIVPRAAAKTLLAATKELRYCGEATTGEEALRKTVSLKPDLILMDVHMPGMDGPAATRAIREINSAVRIVAWTVSEASDDLLRMLQAGCSGYVLKDAGPAELERALLAAVRSETPVPRKMIPDLVRRIGENTPLSRTSTVALTSREMQILRGAAKGFTSKRLAQETGLALPSVETHLRNIFRKLGASNRGEAVSTALKLGLITLADL
jgi:DNA-binding NarL/FixJ family response regulator